MKIVLRPHHIIGLAGYIVELRTSFRNLIVVNSETIKNLAKRVLGEDNVSKIKKMLKK